MKKAASGKSCTSGNMKVGLFVMITIMVFPMVFSVNHSSVFAANPGDMEFKTIPGTVKKSFGSLIAIKTEVGTTRYISRKEVEKRGIPGLAAGDRVFLVLDSGNLLVDIHSRGLSSVKGTIETIHPSDKLLTVRLQNGRMRDYQLKESVLPKLNHIRKGSLLTFEIDKQERIMDFRVN